MAKSAAATVILKGCGVRKEAAAGGAITPGHLIMRNSSNAFVVHATAGARAARLFAIENELAGKEITSAYASGENVVAEVLSPGAEVNALVAAGAAAIVIGDYLESAGDGTLRKVTTVADLTAASGTGDDTVADVGSSFNQTTLNNNFQDLSAKINAILPTGSQAPVAVALQAVDNSGGSSAARIIVEIL